MAIKLVTLDLDNTLWQTDPVIIKAEQACHRWIVENVPQAAEFYTFDALREYKNTIAECYPQLRHKVSELRIEVLRRVFLPRPESAAMKVAIKHNRHLRCFIRPAVRSRYLRAHWTP